MLKNMPIQHKNRIEISNRFFPCKNTKNPWWYLKLMVQEKKDDLM